MFCQLTTNTLPINYQWNANQLSLECQLILHRDVSPIITSYKEVFGETCAHMLIDYQWNANLQCADMFGETCPHMLIDYQLNDN